MSRRLWVILYKYFIFQKIFFSNFQTRFPRLFWNIFGGHIYMNRLVSTSSSALNSQKSKITSKKKLILRLNMALWTFSMSELAKCMSALIFVFSTVGPWITGLGSAYLVTQILRTLSGARASGIFIMAANWS